MMRSNDQSTTDVSTERWARLDEAVERFEQAWRASPRPHLERFLPRQPQERSAVLAELIQVDLELRLKAGDKARVEEYLQRYPELMQQPQVVVEMISREYRWRRRLEMNLQVEEYRRRFPQLATEITTCLSAAAGQAANPLALSPRVLVEKLAASPVLTPGQRAELRSAPPAGDAQALAQDLIARGWLTAFQLRLILEGKAQDLVLGPYLLLDRIGEGGMGQVFKARHQVMKRLVVVKVIRKGVLSYGEQVQRFQREIEAVAQLAHPNIVMAYDAGRAGDVHFFAMEYIDGVDLGRMLRERGPLPIDQACDYIRQAALGLQHAHERGLVHRDIKPNNLMVCRSASEGSPREAVKILDLGLARVQYEATQRTRLTQLGSVMGTPDYIAPEQAIDSSKVDIRADIYSLGCTLYHALAGRPPFPTGTLVDKLTMHRDQEPAPLPSLRQVPAGVAAVVARMMAKRPEERYQIPRGVAEALAPFCEVSATTAIQVTRTPAPPLPVPPLPVPPLPAKVLPGESRVLAAESAAFRRSWLRRYRLAAVVAAVLALCVVSWLLLHRSTITEPETDAAEITNSVGMKLARIPAGTFVMGCPQGEPGWRASEWPPHEVTITRPFYMGVYEVTQEQYEQVVGVNPSHFKAANGGGPSHPVENITFEQAVQYCHRLSELPEEKLAGRRYRLPTSAEWEYACRAGTTTRFFFGDDPKDADAYSWHKSNAQDKTHPVGSVQPNPWGLFDMHGNVNEFCSDWFEPTDNYYQHDSPRDDPLGPANGTQRMVRSGSFLTAAEQNRSAAVFPVQVPNNLQSGLRVVCEARPGGVRFDSKYLDALDPAKLPPQHRIGTPKHLAWVVAPDTVRPVTTSTKPIKMDRAALSVAFSPDGRYLLWGMNDAGMVLWDAASHRVARSAAAQGFTAFAPDGATVLRANPPDGSASLWDIHHDFVYRRFDGGKVDGWDAAFSPDGQWLLSAHLDASNGARLWDVQTGRAARFLPTLGPVRGVAFSPDSKLALTSPGSHAAPATGFMKLWRLERAEEVRRFEIPLPSYGCRPCFSPDGKRVACGTGDGRIRIWNLADKSQDMIELQDPAAGPVPKSNVYDVAFLPDGNRLASVTYGGRVILWDLRDGQFELLANIGSSGYMDLSPDGRYLAFPDSRHGLPRVYLLRLPQ